ncbi:heavy-metal-associated domain-containing protein [Carboxylicivirga marina]|uniref:Heavy-metal-associated domain-containing protein n=1 Tax=Carboxylicivirga marina TaxID=2800988 RepID=A0ABS1HQ97_9BACT|nr:heavy-metal-associated domain-containing protein [Carboxylicivirga marina]MBK3519863.1 heavy-metal-associated domain-containing protein [Carboxylicivirga marina]
MKTLIISIALMLSTIANAQDKNQVTITVFKASITCENCEAKIMKQLPYEKGVRNVQVDVDKKLISVSYKVAKNTDDQLNAAIEKLGYESEIFGQALAFKVYGNCDMCKDRIEEALSSIEGVQSAMWNSSLKEAYVVVGSADVTLIDLQRYVANAGHDTEFIKAQDEVYALLPACCKYSRNK